MMNSDSTESTRPRRCWLLPLAIALMAFAAVGITIDTSGTLPRLAEGPGLTFDETFNVQMGVYHVRAMSQYGLALLHPDSLREVFDNPGYNPDHPPFGRLLLGIAHEITRPQFAPEVPDQNVCVSCARFGTATAFAVTVFLVGWMTSRWYGRSAGVVAAISMLLMPRLLTHAHLASLETFVNLTYVATVLWVAERWSGPQRPRWRDVLIAGVLFGLCLLTKIQAVLLPIPLAVWFVWRWRLRALLPLLLFGLTGLCVFFAGWPWLWLDPVSNLQEYFGRSTGRQTLYCWYGDQKWADTDVPWHYSLVMFAVTVPIGLQLLGLFGAAHLWSAAEVAGGSTRAAAPPTGLLLGNVVWPLLFFALPGITVYDGTRLFLMAFPFWAIFIGIGASHLLRAMAGHVSPLAATGVLALVLLAQAIGIVRMHPAGLSYYNLLTGGLRGAVPLGFEATYWGDSVTRSLLEEVAAVLPPGSVLHVAPVLHPFQLGELASQAPALRNRNIILRPYDDTTGEPVQWVLVIRRRADSWASLTPEPVDGRLIAEVVRDGVQLAGVYEQPLSQSAR